MTDRIRALLTLRNLTPTQFADLIQVGRPIVSHILSGRNKASLEVVQRIIAAFPEIAMPWLLTGTGPMLISAATPLNTVEAQPAAAALPLAPITTAEAPAKTVNPTKTSSAAAETTAAPPVATFKNTKQLAERREGAAESGATKPSAGMRQPLRKFKAPASPNSLSEAPAQVEQATFNSGASADRVTEAAQPPLTGGATHSVVESQAAPNVLWAAQHATEFPPVAVENQPKPLKGNSAVSMSALLADKPIRRIVIFYQDGSFSDFQPEK